MPTTTCDWSRFRLGQTKPEEIERALASGNAQLRQRGDSAAVTQERRFAEILFAAGNSDDLLPMLDAYEADALAKGCGAVVLGGRRGWARKLKTRGYRQVTILIKDFE